MKRKVVILGGGTGLPTLIRGIKYIDEFDLTAIVTVADSGGSTGILTNHFGIPAVGDLRRVIASLSRDRGELEESMEFRISGTNSALDGHTIGNFLLASQILMKGDFAEGIKATTRMLNTQGTILPVSNEFNHLYAEMEDGTIVKGEDNIGHSEQGIKRVFYKEGVASKLSIKAILESDIIILGIGSLYTSLIANLIYPEIKKAIEESKAKVYYFANVFTQHGETNNMTLKDHIKAIEDHLYEGVIDRIVVAKTDDVEQSVIESYKNDSQELVFVEKDIKTTDLVSVTINPKTGKTDLKHDPKKLNNFFKSI